MVPRMEKVFGEKSSGKVWHMALGHVAEVRSVGSMAWMKKPRAHIRDIIK